MSDSTEWPEMPREELLELLNRCREALQREVDTCRYAGMESYSEALLSEVRTVLEENWDGYDA